MKANMVIMAPPGMYDICTDGITTVWTAEDCLVVCFAISGMNGYLRFGTAADLDDFIASCAHSRIPVVLCDSVTWPSVIMGGKEI